MTQAGNSGSGVERPRCACHGEPMWRAGGKRFTCAVDERARNARRIRMSAGGSELFVGRAPSVFTTKIFRDFIRQHREEVQHGWLHA